MTTNNQRIKRAMKELGRDLKRRSTLKGVKASDLNKVGDEMIRLMKKKISIGRSPITGKPFPKYKNPSRYPGDRKAKSPVNLKLSGKFLKDLTKRIKTGEFPTIYADFKSELSRKKERGHRIGVNKQPKRPIIPGRGESLSPSILKLIRPLVVKVLKKYF